MAELLRTCDWASTPLGAMEGWPVALTTAVRLMLVSRFPMWMAVGPSLIVLYNDAYAKTTLGQKHPWALGKPADEVWSEVWAAAGPRIRRVMETGEASWDESLMLILARNGYPEETCHTFSYSPIEDSDGTILGMLCVVIEETTRMIGERQLSALSTIAAELSGAITQREIFAAIARGLSGHKDMPCTLTYLFNEDGRELNLVARTGVDADHPAAASTIELGKEPAAWPLHLVLDENRSATVDNLLDLFPELPPGCWDKPPSRARLAPITKPGQNKPIGIFITALNPYRAFDALYGDFLDLVAGQIAAALTNARAYEEEKKRAEGLAALDRAKTTFFSNVSHELRTPLTLILGPIEDALASKTAPTAASLDRMHRNAMRLLKLVNGLLDFVRIESGRARARYEATDLSLLTAQLAGMFRSAIERAGLQLVVDCPPLPEPVYVDREMWEKVELNLLSNALKSTLRGEIRVAVSATEQEARMSVTDTGTGISESDQAHLFERFERIEGAEQRSYEGSGIGLALVRELVEMHGGRITVESAPGVGTTFTVTVPLGHWHLPQEQLGRTEVTPIELHGSSAAYVQEALGWLPEETLLQDEMTGEAADGWQETALIDKPVVLFADDNRDMREYVTSLLSRRYDVTAVATGRLALDGATKRRPDLVLTDVMMPEMDGFELLQALRQNPLTRTVPVVMLSARAGEEARIDGIDAGADDYVTKPFTARELLTRVEGQLKMARLRKEAAEQEAALTQEINEARRFAWEALEHIPDAFCIFDRDFRVTYMNPAAQQVAALSGKPHMGHVLWDLYPMLKGTPVEVKFRRAMDERVPVEFEQYFEESVNQTWWKFLIYPDADDGIVLYLRDTTSKQKTEEALRGSEKLAAAGRLAASIAHEINNPLEAVTNLLFLAKLDGTLASNTKYLLEMADGELQRLSHIAARSLKFYRQRTAPAATSIEELIESVLFFYKPDMRIRKIKVERRHREAAPVVCLPGEIQQVVTNLIGNAVDAVGETGRLLVAVRPAADRNGRHGVSVTVADTGAGMNRVTLDRLFHPFMTTKGDAGTGLGLWVSKGILDKHDATIAVKSKPGCGTVFRLFLPENATMSTKPQ